ncbi:hypothetical protein FOZ60_015524 [Perkinsus olseni]|uniref:Uncharacterized protein n=1 Tax=Perkinsus olseni TaxID=32597 RepID=A0A7J6N5P1_PEROL|nr:hypothetical protein FOZ60_015524 [Perkinsus olseni]
MAVLLGVWRSPNDSHASANRNEESTAFSPAPTKRRNGLRCLALVGPHIIDQVAEAVTTRLKEDTLGREDRCSGLTLDRSPSKNVTITENDNAGIIGLQVQGILPKASNECRSPHRVLLGPGTFSPQENSTISAWTLLRLEVPRREGLRRRGCESGAEGLRACRHHHRQDQADLIDVLMVFAVAMRSSDGSRLRRGYLRNKGLIEAGGKLLTTLAANRGSGVQKTGRSRKGGRRDDVVAAVARRGAAGYDRESITEVGEKSSSDAQGIWRWPKGSTTLAEEGMALEPPPTVAGRSGLRESSKLTREVRLGVKISSSSILSECERSMLKATAASAVAKGQRSTLCLAEGPRGHGADVRVLAQGTRGDQSGTLVWTSRLSGGGRPGLEEDPERNLAKWTESLPNRARSSVGENCPGEKGKWEEAMGRPRTGGNRPGFGWEMQKELPGILQRQQVCNYFLAELRMVQDCKCPMDGSFGQWSTHPVLTGSLMMGKCYKPCPAGMGPA